MRIGVPAEVKSGENRVALTPDAVTELVAAGHDVLIQADAGRGSHFTNDQYRRAGAHLVPAEDAWGDVHLVVKVKEPQPSEYHFLRSDLVLFTYLHLAATKDCTDALVRSGITAIAYETVELADGALPLLSPMSDIAGRLATQVGAFSLQSANGGRGVLMGGIAGVAPASVVILGAGNAGSQAVDVAVGMGADVTVFDLAAGRLRTVLDRYGNRVRALMSNRDAVDMALRHADLVIGAVLVHGAKAPKLVTNDQVRNMKAGSVLVDIAIDQGGCFEDSRPTTHADPLYSVHNSRFYAVANMPAAVPNTSTSSLVNATLPYIRAIANAGWRRAVSEDPALAKGVNVIAGHITVKPVAEAHGYAVTDLNTIDLSAL
ncbi:alanine dehydrogenase [Hoyosella rhizosphaerae]|uniref:Alanine dehydrogenase n=1 Tax=Hoyosella rhizosphaerae TaxID=1755582 RepID=A0A916TYQ9_9ACTN|nr:alanine dehydrogenase [Hoyosella rhizosphaerae]MBN4927368.1 alanine dehydrogenase [Hoyosella rhizosphaerae]GGC51825.1 alanine dehydrogenase [Hoyosella rhizosphaerae]